MAKSKNLETVYPGKTFYDKADALKYAKANFTHYYISKRGSAYIVFQQITKDKHSNPSIITSTDHDWIPVHAIRKTPEGNIEVMVERGTLANPGKKKKVLSKIKKMFSK